VPLAARPTPCCRLLPGPVSRVDGDGPPLFAHNEHTSLSLASTAKLATTMAALELLGPTYRWQTRAYALGPLRDGVLQGDLLIVGGGDVRLASADLQSWFRKLQIKGLREIHGNLVFDRGVFQTRAADHVNTPLPSADKPYHAWPDALTVDEGVITVEITRTAQGPSLSYHPRLEGVQLLNLLQVSHGKCRSIKAPPMALFDDPAWPDAVVVRGEWAPACAPSRLLLATPASGRFTALALVAAWRDSGGVLKGQAVPRNPAVAAASVPRGLRPFAVHDSAPLRSVLRDMNKWSNNLIARHLMLSLSKGFPGRPATMAEARKRMALWTHGQGFAGDDLVLDNGSGLSHNERGRASVLVQLLRKAWHGPFAQDLYKSLPVAGKDGTLSTRFKGPTVRGHASLKTGTLIGARSLAGYVEGRSGRTYAVAAIINDPKADQGVSALDAFIEWVVDNG
jgi:D-alanyl-D-alanine carboxypeptidase/D-alanyl-D-alanine-endopeptidase (penicillin-binding protein 4)